METWCTTRYETPCESPCDNSTEIPTEIPTESPFEPCGVAEWVRGLARGNDPHGWNLFVRRYSPWLRRRCWYMLQRGRPVVPPDELDELVQEVYCRLLANRRRHLRCFRGDSEKALRTFLARVARGVVLDHLRYRYAFKRSSMLRISWGCASANPRARPATAAGETEVEPLDRVPCLRVSPEREALRRQQRRLFFRRCRETDGGRSCRRNAEIVWLALLEGWSSREIAPRVSLSPSAVDTVVHRARRRLEAKGIDIPERL
jgi:RNA polymerase sigma factor (sigma-70 family)